MADNVQPEAGEQREESSGLLLSVDPLQDVVAYRLAADDDDTAVDDSDGDAGDGDGSDADSSDDGGETLVVVDGANDSGDSDENSDADATDDADGDTDDDD
jgi:hypothetical protein